MKPGIIALSAILLMSAGCAGDWIPTPKDITRAQLDGWLQEFRLYHGFHREPAASLEVVLAEVREKVLASLPENQRQESSTEELKRFVADAWGTHFQFSYAPAGETTLVTVFSAGPDRRFGTGDDLQDSLRITLPKESPTP